MFLLDIFCFYIFTPISFCSQVSDLWPMISCFYLDIITQEEMTITPKKLKAYLDKVVKKHPEKHSRYSQQAWLYPDKSTDSVFQAVQSRFDIELLTDFLLLK